jgi:general secretion pathway protein D
MSIFNRLTAVLAAVALLGTVLPVEARNRQGDKFLAQGRSHEEKKEWDAALEAYEKALSEDPAELVYQMAVEKARFQTGQVHIDRGLKLRAQGQLAEALAELQKAYAIDPSSAIAVQEVQLTSDMIARDKQRVATTGKQPSPAESALTPLQEYKKTETDRLNRILSVPLLKPLNPERINLKMNNKTKVLYETVAKYAGVNILWDPEFTPPARDGFNIDLQDLTIEQALDYLSMLTKTFWKPISPNTIFLTMDNPNKRRDYEEWVTKTFYLQNVSSQQELQEIVNAVRTITDIAKIYQYLGQNALVVRGEADKVELAQKIIRDLDKPKSEVVVDVLVIEATSAFSRQLTAAIANGTGLNIPVTFSPRSKIQVQGSTTNNNNNNNNNGNNGNNGNNTTNNSSSTSGVQIPLSQLPHLSSADFATTLPGALLQAAMSDTRTKILQSPQLRSVDNVKATLKIGSREPTATGSYQPGVAGVGVSSLVNTQFTYIDVGVNVELTPRVHDNGEVSMHISIEISNIAGTVNLGGIAEPIIGQRKVDHDIRMREGEVGLLGGLINTEEDKSLTGIPGLSSIPILGKLFSGTSTTHNRDELMIVLIPHVIRRPEITEQNLRPVATGNQLNVKLNHAGIEPQPATEPRPAAAPGTQPAVPEAAVPVPVVPPAAPVEQQPVPPAAGGLPATAPPLAPTAAPPPTGGATPQALGPARVHFVPAQVDTDVGSTMSVALAVDNGADVSAAPMIITWDSKVLRLNSIVMGDLLAQKAQMTQNVQNDQGRASVMLNVPAGSPGVTAPTGTLVNLNFQAIGHGSTQVTVPQLTVRNSQSAVVVSGSPQLTVNVK